MTTEQRIKNAEERIAAAGFVLTYVDYCEDAETPGILGVYRGVTIWAKKKVKVATKHRTRQEIAEVLEHEAHHCEDPLWDCGNRDVLGNPSGAEQRRTERRL